MKKALLQILIVVLSLIVGYYIGRSKNKKNKVVEFIYKGKISTLQSDSITLGEEPVYATPIKNSVNFEKWSYT